MRAVVVVVVLGLVACSTKPNPNRCCTDTADCASAGISEVTPCGDGLVCRGNQCIAEGCTASSECDGAAPYCVSQACAEQCADDSQCPGFGQDSTAIFCVNGGCDQCRTNADCSATAPTCDMGTCRGCSVHADCASNLCDTDTATCVPEAEVIYADTTGGTTSDCTMSAPCSLERAFAVVSTTRDRIKLAPGTYSNSGVLVNGPSAVTLYGPATVSGGVGITAQDGGTLRVRDLISNGGIGCVNSQTGMPLNHVDLERVTFGDNQLLYIDSCAFTMSHVKMHVPGANLPAIQLLDDDAPTLTSSLVIDDSIIDGGDPAIGVGSLSTFTITNTFFTNQGTTKGAFQFVNAQTTTSSVSFSTFFNTLIKCPIVQGNGSFNSSNNIILNQRANAPADTATGTYCTHNYDLVRPQTTALNGGNNQLGVDPKFVNPGSSDFHLQMTSPAIDAADPAATLSTDYDGTTRPQGAGRDLGAFEYKP